jgi:hypothetical protein
VIRRTFSLSGEASGLGTSLLDEHYKTDIIPTAVAMQQLDERAYDDKFGVDRFEEAGFLVDKH